MNNKSKLSSLAALASLFLFGCSPDSRVALVKEGSLDECPKATLGEMVDSYIGSPSWEAGESEEGDNFVNIKGTVMYSEKEVDLVLQFMVNTEKGTFEYNALEFNEIPQNNFIAFGLLSNMCDEVTK